MQFLVIAHDGTDAGAQERRAKARPGHLARVEPMSKTGELIDGGALLDGEGRMVGSALIVEAADRVALDAWLAVDPYTTGGVWQRFDIRPFRRAPFWDKK